MKHHHGNPHETEIMQYIINLTTLDVTKKTSFTQLLIKTKKKQTKKSNLKCNALWECQFMVIRCTSYILFPLPKTVCYRKITCNVQYSFSPYIIGQLTVNHLTGFYCRVFTVFYRYVNLRLFIVNYSFFFHFQKRYTTVKLHVISNTVFRRI